MTTKPGFGFSLRSPNMLRIYALVALVVAWQIIGMNINPIFLSTPAKVLVAFTQLAGNGSLGAALWITFLEFAAGFIASIAVGIPIGFLAGRYDSLYYFLDPFVNIFFAMPTIALLPLFVIWFGLGFEVKVVIIFLSTVFPVIINTEAGVKETDTSLVEVAKSFGAKEGELFSKVIIPASVPYVIVGLRVGIARALVTVIVAELYTSSTGLGGMMNYFSNYYQTANFFVPVIVLAILSLVIVGVVNTIQGRLSRWRTS
jgi:ABC-type nitrate/sulfonate/bicarbonate transport system permease component